MAPARGVVIVGRGRVGSALAEALRAAGVPVQRTGGRAPRGALVRGARAVVLAVPDPALEATAGRIAPFVGPQTAVLHVAGARGVEVLEPCRAAGAHLGAMHPLVSFASKRPPALAGASFLVAGDGPARREAKRLVRAVGARALVAPIHGAAYHAGAALAANGTVALAGHAVDVLVALGLGRRESERAIGVLLRTVADNVATLGLPRALTGPIARGDAATVLRHREALGALDPAAAAAYDAITPSIVRLARRLGADVGPVQRALHGAEPGTPRDTVPVPRS